MNTIPTTTDHTAVPYTVVGGHGIERDSQARWPITALILNRAGRFQRQQLIEQLTRFDFAEILCLESGAVGYDLEAQCREYPRLRFLLLQDESHTSSVGLRLNLGIQEARSAYVLVLWSDLSVLPFVEASMRALLERRLLCAVPLVRSIQGEVVPTLAMPVEHRNNLKILHTVPSRDTLATLYPYDYVGIYQRERFLQTQGFDPQIANPFWQKLDFGYRSWLWGERIQCHSELRLQASLEIASEDSTPDADYARFYLKNLLPRFTGDQAELPRGRFWTYHRVSGSGLLRDWRYFRSVETWVRSNAYRFKHDARYIAELWETGGGV